MPPVLSLRNEYPRPNNTSRKKPSPSKDLEALLRDLDPVLQRADTPQKTASPPRPHPSGIAKIDELLGGGFPAGRLSEVTGAPSSGRTTLLLSLLARTTQKGEWVALVDRADSFDPPSAEASGVVLERVLWVRAPDWRATLRCVECLLETDGLPLVAMNWTGHPRRGESGREKIPDSAWLRLARRARTRPNTALLLFSNERLAGSRASLVLEMKPATASFTGTPRLLEALEPRPVLMRSTHEPRFARRPALARQHAKDEAMGA